MKNIKKYWLLLLLPALLAPMGQGCQKEYLDPSAPAEDQVLSSVDGLIFLCNGMQRRYSFARQSPVYTTMTASGLSSLEHVVTNVGNTDEANLTSGKDKVDNLNAVVNNVWTQNILVINEADKVLNNIGIATDAGDKAGLQVYAHLYKAMALGNLCTFFEQVPDKVGVSGATFVPRNEGLRRAVQLLEQALPEVSKVGASFNSKILTGVDLANTINALIARYSLMNGDNDKALSAAGAVDLTKKSVFKYDATSPNTVRNVIIANNTYNIIQPRDINMGLPAELKPDSLDKRVLFFIKTTTPKVGPTGIVYSMPYVSADNSDYPVYLPGEMILIKAEALARKNMLTEAIAELDKVRTKAAAGDAWGIGAALAAYSGATDQAAVLTEIYRNRCIELFGMGLRLEDSRRFGRPGPNDAGAERNRNFYPYPATERNNNPNTPADPAI